MSLMDGNETYGVLNVSLEEYEALKQENERLRAENKEAVREVRRLVQVKVDLQAELERLRANLAEANERVAAYENWDGTKNRVSREEAE